LYRLSVVVSSVLVEFVCDICCGWIYVIGLTL
jgi:hypothetical protein